LASIINVSVQEKKNYIPDLGITIVLVENIFLNKKKFVKYLKEN